MKTATFTSAVLLCVVSAYLSQAGAGEFYADLVVVNARVITVDLENPRAEAFAVKGDRFIAVGTNSEIEKLIGEDTMVLEAPGKTVAPGFIDAHLHPRPVYPVHSRL